MPLSRMCDPSLSGKRALGEHADSDNGHPWESLSHRVSGEAGSTARRMKSSSFGDYEGATPSGDGVSQRPWIFRAELPSWCARCSCWMEPSLHTVVPLHDLACRGWALQGRLLAVGYARFLFCVHCGWERRHFSSGAFILLASAICNKMPPRRLGFSPNRSRVKSHKDSLLLSVDRTRVKK